MFYDQRPPPLRTTPLLCRTRPAFDDRPRAEPPPPPGPRLLRLCDLSVLAVAANTAPSLTMRAAMRARLRQSSIPLWWCPISSMFRSLSMPAMPLARVPYTAWYTCLMFAHLRRGLGVAILVVLHCLGSIERRSQSPQVTNRYGLPSVCSLSHFPCALRAFSKLIPLSTVSCCIPVSRVQKAVSCGWCTGLTYVWNSDTTFKVFVSSKTLGNSIIS
mmetsp:Transcript_3532/g.7056  ORF Transcript_3532/g.7056 Transcript_3532/m.7056 type:complete len:216 (+) Transcript_3532:210-857(+)